MTARDRRTIRRLVELLEDARPILDDAVEAGVRRARGLAKRIDKALPVAHLLCEERRQGTEETKA